MNEEDKKRFARYRPGYKEPPPPPTDLEAKNGKKQADTSLSADKDKDKDKVKDTLGFVEEIEIDPDDLISQVINEMEQKVKPLEILQTHQALLPAFSQSSS